MEERKKSKEIWNKIIGLVLGLILGYLSASSTLVYLIFGAIIYWIMRKSIKMKAPKLWIMLLIWTQELITILAIVYLMITDGSIVFVELGADTISVVAGLLITIIILIASVVFYKRKGKVSLIVLVVFELYSVFENFYTIATNPMAEIKSMLFIILYRMIIVGALIWYFIKYFMREKKTVPAETVKCDENQTELIKMDDTAIESKDILDVKIGDDKRSNVKIRFCYKCGSELVERSRFCSICGTMIPWEE